MDDKSYLEKKYILEYIRDMLNDFLLSQIRVNNAKYHHNTNYRDVSSIVKYGICSLEKLHNLGKKNYSSEYLNTMSDIESHINGIDAVSLSVVGLDDLYPGEEEYFPFSPTNVDFLVSSDIKVVRNSIHYGNEFLSYESIDPKHFRAIDIRLIKLIQQINLNKNELQDGDNQLMELIKKYNLLTEIANALKKSQYSIPLREMSYDNDIELDIDKIANSKKLVLK